MSSTRIRSLPLPLGPKNKRHRRSRHNEEKGWEDRYEKHDTSIDMGYREDDRGDMDYSGGYDND